MVTVMAELVIQNSNGNDITTSLIVAQVFGKEHKHVLRDIDELSCSDDFRKSNFGLSFTIRELPNGGSKKDRFYEMTKDGFSFLVMGYTGAKAGQFKEMFIAEFNKREMMLKNDDYILMRSMQILQKRVQAIEAENKQLEAENAAKQERIELQEQTINVRTEENKVLKASIEKQAPFVEYVSTTLQSPKTYTSTQMAKELGMRTANELHNRLRDMGIMYKQSGQWMLTSKYCGKGYTKPRTTSGMDEYGKAWSNTITVWTETGRMFLHEKFDNKDAKEVDTTRVLQVQHGINAMTGERTSAVQ